MNRLIKLISAACCLFSAVAFAALPKWYPQSFDSYGIIDTISSNSISIEKRQFILSPTAKVSTVDSKVSDIGQIKPGQTIGVDIITINNRKLVDHIWLIPEGEKIISP